MVAQSFVVKVGINRDQAPGVWRFPDKLWRPIKIYGWRNFFEVLNTTEKFEFTTWERIEGHMQHSTMVICKKRCVQNIQIEAFSSHLCSILFNLLDHKWLGILSSQGVVINLVIVCCGAIRSKSWSHPRLQNRNLSWAMVGWCIITSTKSKTKQWDPGFWLALVRFIGLGPSFHPLQNRNLNWAIFERSRGEENKRQFVNHNKG